VTYRERLWPGPWIFIATALLIPGGLLVFLPIGVWVGIPASIILYAAAVVFLVATTPTVSVDASTFTAGRARLPLAAVGEVAVISGDEAFIARGRGLDARAYTLIRGWVKDVVRIENIDPNDPAPYWLVSSRRPEELAAALDAARQRSA